MGVAGSILDMGESVRTAAAEEQASLNIPLLVTHGTADVITSYEASRQFVESLACADKTLKSYSGAYHNCKTFPLAD